MMTQIIEHIQSDVRQILREWEDSAFIHPGDLFVIGCSTSEMLGEHIGSAGSEELAEILFTAFDEFRRNTNVKLVFQCCEHLNRALVMERETLENAHQSLEEVSVIPAPDAGGSMATHAFKHFHDACVVESVQADAGMDIGDTLIGMQLKRVAVPVRFHQKYIGRAHVTSARTRPKLIGGKRAHYE